MALYGFQQSQHGERQSQQQHNQQIQQLQLQQQHRHHHHHQHRQQLRQQPIPALDANRGTAYFDEDDSATVLDPRILDTTEMMQSPSQDGQSQFRKDSFAPSNNGVLSPAESQGWEQQYTASSTQPIDHASTTTSVGQFRDDVQSFPPLGSSHAPIFVQPHPQHPQPSSWSNGNVSGTGTPITTAIDFMPPPPSQFSPSNFANHRNDVSSATVDPSQYAALSTNAKFVPAPQVHTPMSPQSHQDWMAMAQQEMDSRPMSRRMRQDSPPRTMVDLQRRDGIRKKNGRIEIPLERNIHTIDDMIERTKDEDMLKELKQQKRLLRNREAALASRQRKKKHTEDLEVREKSFTNQISLIEQQLQEVSIERDGLSRDRQILLHRNQEFERIVEAMQMEKRDLIMKHAEETSSLRKKVHVLTEQLEHGPAPAMSAAPSSTGFTDFNAEMEALSMGTHEWDNFVLLNDFHNDTQEDFAFEPSPADTVRTSMMNGKKPPVVPIALKSTTDASTDQHIASGLIFMLLLCGAFVASKPQTASSSDLPNMPAHVRAAAPAVLNNLLAEASNTANAQHARALANVGHEPAPSGMVRTHARPVNRMEQMHQRLISPTKQQEIDAAFALTPAQYASLTNTDYPVNDEQHHNNPSQSASRPRRNLAEVLASGQQPDAESKAEVYTRSLLWDQIPADVVKQFKEMVRDHNDLEARERQQQAHQGHGEYPYKLEQ